jgi:hypothetical protein
MTDGRGRRLRLRAALALLFAFAVTTTVCPGREARLTVLVAASVADDALGTITPEAWAKYVAGSLGRYRLVTFAGAATGPTAEDCRKAGADYLVAAQFDLRPRLPGLPSGGGRISAQGRLHVVDCVTGAAAAEQVVNFESDPLETLPGDADASTDSRWEREIPAALAKQPLDLRRPARVLFVTSPLARVRLRDSSVRPGDVLRDVATAKNEPREHPIRLTVTQVFADSVEVLFDAGAAERPQPGDYVER